jgi:hypothetical protein
MSRGDELLIGRIEAGTQTARALLCALARRGKALARDQPDRAQALLGAFRAHPSYKAGRVVFDLLELEDLMLDGPPPERIDGYFETEGVAALTRLFERLHDAVDSQPESGPSSGRLLDGRGVTLEPEPAPAGGWPTLQASEYLFDLVVLGLLRQLSRVAAASATRP